MIHRLVNLDYPETPAQRRLIEARQLASCRVTRKPTRHVDPLAHRRLVTTPTRLRPTSEAWLNRISLVTV